MKEPRSATRRGGRGGEVASAHARLWERNGWAQVVLLKNLDFTSGLVNGTRGVVVRFSESDQDGAEEGVEYPVVKFDAPPGASVVTPLRCHCSGVTHVSRAPCPALATRWCCGVPSGCAAVMERGARRPGACISPSGAAQVGVGAEHPQVAGAAWIDAHVAPACAHPYTNSRGRARVVYCRG